MLLLKYIASLCVGADVHLEKKNEKNSGEKNERRIFVYLEHLASWETEKKEIKHATCRVSNEK